MVVRHALPVLLLLSGCGRLGFDLLGDRDMPASEPDAAVLVDAALDDGSDGAPGAEDGGPASMADAATTDGGAVGNARTLALVTVPYVAEDALWARVAESAPEVQYTILNPSSGPGSARDEAFVSRVNAARAAGIRVLGYVTTDYTGRSLAAVEGDIDRYRDFYEVDGFFLDQASQNCRDQPYYAGLYDYVRSLDGTLEVVLDPGASLPSCFAESADKFVVFQGTLSDYELHDARDWELAEPPARFWHMVYAAYDEQDLARAFELAHARHVGAVYVTDDDQPNPWDTLPGDRYWTRERELTQP